MPPAFNLSQDQTLQFNPTNTHNSLTVDFYIYLDGSLHPCDCLNTLCDRSHFASRHPHLSVVQIFKDHAAPFRLIRQQQRSEIMKNLLLCVKRFSTLFFFNFASLPSPTTAGNPRRCRRGAHYIDPTKPVNHQNKINSKTPKPTTQMPLTTRHAHVQNAACRPATPPQPRPPT